MMVAPVEINGTGGETEDAVTPPRESVPAEACCCIVVVACVAAATFDTVTLNSTMVDPMRALSTSTFAGDTENFVATSATTKVLLTSHAENGRFRVASNATELTAALPAGALVF